MALSASFDFSLNTNEFIKEALLEAGVTDENESPSNVMNEFARRRFNMMLKSWQGDGLQLWIHREAFIFLEKAKVTYSLPGDNFTESYTETAVKTAASSAATTLDVDSTSGMTAADYIGVEVDDGTMHWTTVASVTDSDTVELTDALDDDAAVDNVVYFYTTQAPRPLRITDCTRKVNGGTETTMWPDARSDYWGLSDKSTSGTPSQYWFSPYRSASELRLYQPSDKATDILKVICHFPFDDLDSGTDDIVFPSYWYEAIFYGLAYRLAVKYKVLETRDMKILRDMAKSRKDAALDFDVEPENIELEPDERGLY